MKIKVKEVEHIHGVDMILCHMYLLNYNYELNDVSTLLMKWVIQFIHIIQEKNNHIYYAGYTLFCAEVASTTNESLLIHYLINKETDKKKKLIFNKSRIRTNKNYSI